MRVRQEHGIDGQPGPAYVSGELVMSVQQYIDMVYGTVSPSAGERLPSKIRLDFQVVSMSPRSGDEVVLALESTELPRVISVEPDRGRDLTNPKSVV